LNGKKGTGKKEPLKRSKSRAPKRKWAVAAKAASWLPPPAVELIEKTKPRRFQSERRKKKPERGGKRIEEELSIKKVEEAQANAAPRFLTHTLKG